MRKFESRFPPATVIALVMVVVAAGSAGWVGCTPSIGDACEANADCDTDQICDLSQTGGYCTISPCPRAGCPSGSICVEFSPISTWCMQRCDVFDYCRVGYDCVSDFVDFNGVLTDPFCRQSATVDNTDTIVVDSWTID